MNADRELILYIAASLDGFIARENGDIDWLSAFEEADTDYGYQELISSVDTVIMGRKTYSQVLTFGAFPYAGKRCIVVSKTPRSPDQWVEFWSGDVAELLSGIRREEGSNIWLVGGGELMHAFAVHNLIDRHIISVIPILLGTGIPLFRKGRPECRLKLLDSAAYPSGLVQLTYERLSGS